jgi:hypothetical protein
MRGQTAALRGTACCLGCPRCGNQSPGISVGLRNRRAPVCTHAVWHVCVQASCAPHGISSMQLAAVVLQDRVAYAEQAASGVNLRLPKYPVGADTGNSAAASEAITDARYVAGSMDDFDDEVKHGCQSGAYFVCAAGNCPTLCWAACCPTCWNTDGMHPWLAHRHSVGVTPWLASVTMAVSSCPGGTSLCCYCADTCCSLRCPSLQSAGFAQQGGQPKEQQQ